MNEIKICVPYFDGNANIVWDTNNNNIYLYNSKGNIYIGNFDNEDDWEQEFLFNDAYWYVKIGSMLGKFYRKEKSTHKEEIKDNIVTKYNLNDELRFGKYKGKTILEIIKESPSYIKWCGDNVEGFSFVENEDFRKLLKKYLDREQAEIREFWEGEDNNSYRSYDNSLSDVLDGEYGCWGFLD